MSHRLHVVVHGRVQGVGFRYATCRQAGALGLTGWVRNTYTGAVEAEFEGERLVLEQMLDWCGNGPSFARVTNVEHTWLEEGPHQYDDFRVRG